MASFIVNEPNATWELFCDRAENFDGLFDTLNKSLVFMMSSLLELQDAIFI